MHFTLLPRLLIIEARLFIVDMKLLMMESIQLLSSVGSTGALELIDEDMLEDEDDLALEDDDAFKTGLIVTLGLSLMMRASVVQRPGTMWSSSEVQCSMPVQSLGE